MMKMQLFTGVRYLSCMTCLFLTVYNVESSIRVYDPQNVKVEIIQDREPIENDFDPMIGYIVLADPAGACTPISEPTFLTNFSIHRFVLINGSDRCDTNTKIRYADKAGFDLAVVFHPFEFIHIAPFENHIPVVFVSYEDGVRIKNRYLYNISSIYNYKLQVIENEPDYNYYIYLFCSVIGVCFFVMLLFMICLLIKCIQERRKSRRNRLSSRQIKQIPTVKYCKGDQYDVCAICLEDYNEGDKLRILPCSHAYHAKCIDPWLMNNRRNCPLCKRKITFGDSADESDSEDSELTSPAENTPLLTSPVNRGASWGTFVNPVRTLNDLGLNTGGPSSLPNTFQYTDNSRQPTDASAAAESPDSSDDDNFHPATDGSVNTSTESIAELEVHNQVLVQVNYPNGNSNQGASTSHHGFVV